MTEAKRAAFLHGVETGTLDTNRAKVLRQLIHRGSLTLAQLCNLLRMPEKSVVGRISELMDMGLVYVERTLKKESHSVSLFRFEDQPWKRQKHASDRTALRFDKWLEKGKREFPEYLTKERIL